MRSTTQCNFIYEANTSTFNYNNIQLLEEIKVPGNEIPKIAFESRLQKTETNKNGREYTPEICQEIVNLLKPMSVSRCLYQEIDHPNVDASTVEGKQRATKVEYKSSGSLIRNIHFTSDGEIIGEIETLSGFYGPDVTKLLMYDKADIGFSLRMFGKLITDNTTGHSRVAKPIMPITYDIVTNPSHPTSRVVRLLPESISEFRTNNDTDISFMQENIDNIKIYDTNESLITYLDKLIIESFNTMRPLVFKL